MGSLQSVQRVEKLFTTATKVVNDGREIIKTADKIWTTMQGTYDTTKLVVIKVDGIMKNQGSIIDKIATAKEVVEDIKTIKDNVLEIWDEAKGAKDQFQTLWDDCIQLKNELSQWRKFKQEIEADFNTVKLEVLKAVATAKKGAIALGTDAKDGLIALEKSLGSGLVLETATEAIKAKLLKEFQDALTNYSWIAFGLKSDQKDLQKAVVETVTKSLDKLLTNAVAYATESEVWKKVEGLETAINALVSDFAKLLGKTKEKEITFTKDLTDKLEEWKSTIVGWVGEKANAIMGPLTEFVGPAFEFFKSAAKIYGIVRGFPDALEEKLPHTFSKELFKYDSTIFSFDMSIPVASLGWVSLNITVGFSISGKANVTANFTVFNVFDVKELKIMEGNVEASGSLTLSGYVGMSVDLVQIVELGAKASLSATVGIKDLKGAVLLTRNSSDDLVKGGVTLSANGTLEFGVKGALTFYIQLTNSLRKLIKWVSGFDAKAEWNLVEVELFKASVSKKVSTKIDMNVKHIDWKALIELLKDRTIYRMENAARNAIEQSLSSNVGSRKNWEEKAKGQKLSDKEVEELYTKYIKPVVMA